MPWQVTEPVPQEEEELPEKDLPEAASSEALFRFSFLFLRYAACPVRPQTSTLPCSVSKESRESKL